VSELATMLGGRDLLASARGDVAVVRERHRRRRLAALAGLLALAAAFLWYRIADGRPFQVFALPRIGGDPLVWAPALALTLLLAVVLLAPLASQRSPHLVYRPEQIDVTFDDVKGLGPVVDEVVRTLGVFLGYATFREALGGTPRRGLLFEGPPGTGKTHLAKALARHAGVPFLYVAGPAFQSHWYGMTARRIRAFFRALRRTARREGGVIGFIEEIDAFATARGSLEAATPPGGPGRLASPVVASGTGGTVNELLIQMQSFDVPPPLQRILGRLKDLANLFLPPGRQLRHRPPPYHNVLVIAATNRADALDPALLRPGRFDRRLYFDLPSRAGRRELIDHFLARKRHAPELDDDARRDELAALTFGYTPAKIEHLFDEALIVALRNGRDAMTWADVAAAKLAEDVGLPHPEAYGPEERRRIATHEAGHAVAAHLAGEGRRLEVLSIVKRRQALGLLAHSDAEERFTRTRSELEALLVISMAGMAAEELFEGESGTGPAGDLAQATQVAAEMVGALGLGGSLASYRAAGESPFAPDLVSRVLADAGGRRAVDALLRRARAEARRLLRAHRRAVLALRDALLEREELVGEEIVAVIEAAGGRRAVRRSVGRRPVRRPSVGRRQSRAPTRAERR
jgi:cell division protease FtsH